MSQAVQADPIPLRMDEQGTLRIGDSRITLDVLVEEYEKGASPEALVAAYDALELADVFAVLAYYLRHRDEVKSYLQRREQEAGEIRQKLEASGMTWPEARETLLARHAERKQKDHASPGE